MTKGVQIIVRIIGNREGELNYQQEMWRKGKLLKGNDGISLGL